MSHTVKVQVKLQNKSALGKSVQKLEGSVLGEGQHRLFAGLEEGFGFTLPKWRYPLVLKPSNELAYDDYNGKWGNLADLDRLKECYALEVAKATAEAQGWLHEEIGNGLVIHHPDGGTLTVLKDGTVDANNFLGSGCTSATASLEAALGARQEEQLKDEYFAERAHVQALL